MKPPRNVPLLVFVIGMFFMPMIGCNSDPPIYPVTGKVTLDGKAYQRLIVYMRPKDSRITQFNMGVGETDSDGNLTFGSAAGAGVQAGIYRVSFSCMQTPTGQTIDVLNEKFGEDGGPEPVELVPPPYDYRTNADSSPLEFRVSSDQSENNFVFDIPIESS